MIYEDYINKIADEVIMASRRSERKVDIDTIEVKNFIYSRLSKDEANKFLELCKHVKQVLDEEYYAWDFVTNNGKDIRYLLCMGAFRMGEGAVTDEDINLFARIFKELYQRYKMLWLYKIA